MKNHLKTVLKDIEDFVKDHKLLKTYMDNILTEVGNTNVMYPLVYIEQGNVDVTDGEIVINMVAYVADKLLGDKSDFIDILNNMMLCAIDLRDYFRQRDCNCDWFIDPSSTMTPARFIITNDESAGYQFNLSVKIKHTLNKDSIPI